MARFEGTIKEFAKFVGPFARLKVAFLSAKHKKLIGKCEECDSTNNLDAAHIKGKASLVARPRELVPVSHRHTRRCKGLFN